jgi:hypothetical protein
MGRPRRLGLGSARAAEMGTRAQQLLILPDAQPIHAHLLRVDARVRRFRQATDRQRKSDVERFAERVLPRGLVDVRRGRVEGMLHDATDVGRTVWEAVLEFIRESEPISGSEVQRRFVHDDAEVVSGVLHDLVNSGLTFRSGRGDGAVYRAAAEADFAVANGSGADAAEWLVWLTVYRRGPLSLSRVAEATRLPPAVCEKALFELSEQGRIGQAETDGQVVYRSERFEVPLGESQGWEAAVLDHYQAMTSAICAKLAERGAGARAKDIVGGSTWSLDVWAGHPLEEEATKTLARVRAQLEELRTWVDQHNEQSASEAPRQRVVVYVGQYVRGQ